MTKEEINDDFWASRLPFLQCMTTTTYKVHILVHFGTQHIATAMTPVNLNSIRKLRSLVPRYARIASRRSTYRPCAVYPDRRCFSTEEAAKEESKEGDDILSSSEEEPNEIKVIFPWRHDATPLPRLVEGTLDHARLGQRLSTATSNIGSPEMNTWASAFMFLDVPLYQFLFFSSWKEELADNMSWAFTQGVAGLLSTIASKNGESCLCSTRIV